MLIETLSGVLRKARDTNDTAALFADRVPTATQPTGAGVFELGGPAGGSCPRAVLVLPYGAGSDGDTLSVRVWGWRAAGTGAARLWVPVLLAELLGTLTGSQPGVTGRVVGATELFADTLAVVGTAGTLGVSVDATSPANNTAAHAVIDVRGAQLVEFTFTTGGSATSANALFATL